MQILQNIYTIVGIPVAVLGTAAFLIAFGKWLTAKLHAPKATATTPSYDYCLISRFKDRLSFYGYFYALTAEEQILPYLEPYNILRDLSFSVEPNRQIPQHFAAFNRLVARLRADGWEYADHPDDTLWYAQRFRRRKGVEQNTTPHGDTPVLL